MMTMRTRMVVSMALALVGCAVHAQQVPEEQDNAALWYWQVFYSSQRYTGNVMEDAGKVLDSDGADEQAAEAVRNHVGAHWEQLQTAVSKPRCAFGVNWDKGWMALLPHVKPMRDWAQLLAADALGRAQDGELDLAAERLATALRMADHMGQEPIVISLLTASAMVGEVNDVMQKIDTSSMSDDARQELLRSITSVEDIDREWLADVFISGGAMTRAYMKKRWSGPAGERRMIEDFGMIADVNTGQSPAPGPYESLDEQYTKWKALDQQIAEALRTGDRQRMTELGRSIAGGDHGWLARIFVTRFERPFEAIVTTQQRIDRMRKKLGL